ncbi:hypothetical protein BG004_003612 [Podila humilis]|nr:hypothetical protein BG004_003612 [Podila humilis]
MILNPLHNQVGGHEGVLSMGEDNEIIVKPSLPQELAFYEESVLHPELATWMPAFYGSLTLTRDPAVIAAMTAAEASTTITSTATNTTTTTTTTTSSTVTTGAAIKAFNGYPVGDLLPLNTFEVDANKDPEVPAPLEKGEFDSDCICLENVSHGFFKACVLDLKLGTQLFDDEATDEKKARLGAVSDNTTSGKLGLRLTGFHVYDGNKGEFIKYSKQYGKSLTEATVLDGFRAFFAATLGPLRMRLVIERFVSDLTDFLATIQEEELRMRSSSLLMMYEGDVEAFDRGVLEEQGNIAKVVERAQAHLERQKEKGDDDEEDEDEEDDDDDEDDEDDEVKQKVTDMRLIDFAHSIWTPGLGPDEGVVLGVKSALSLFEQLLANDYPEDE